MQGEAKKSRLTHVELAAIDLTITALQAAGRKITDVAKDDTRVNKWRRPGLMRIILSRNSPSATGKSSRRSKSSLST